MKLLPKALFTGTLLCSLILAPLSAQAATSILPSFNNGDGAPCELNNDFLEEVAGGQEEFQKMVTDAGDVDVGANFLACALKLGYIRIWMLPFFALYAIQFIIGLAGLIAVLMVVLGGYYYVIGGVTDDKEKGKTIITYALVGFVIVITSWFVVNLVLLALTS